MQRTTVYVRCSFTFDAPNSGFLNSLRKLGHSAVCAVASPLLGAAITTNSTLGVGAGGSAGVGFILGIAA
jgi:hypothetical protein